MKITITASNTSTTFRICHISVLPAPPSLPSSLLFWVGISVVSSSIMGSVLTSGSILGVEGSGSELEGGTYCGGGGSIAKVASEFSTTNSP